MIIYDVRMSADGMRSWKCRRK